MKTLVKAGAPVVLIAAVALFLSLIYPSPTAAAPPSDGGAPVIVNNTPDNPVPTTVTNASLDVNVTNTSVPTTVQNTVSATVTNWPDPGYWRPYEIKSSVWNILEGDEVEGNTIVTSGDVGTGEVLVIEYVSVACSQSAGTTTPDPSPQSIWARLEKIGSLATGVDHFIAPSQPSVAGTAILGQAFRFYVEGNHNVAVSVVRSATDGNMSCQVSLSGHIVPLPE